MTEAIQEAISRKQSALPHRNTALTVLRLLAVKHRTGLSRSTIYAKVADGEFPPPIKLGEGARAVGWLEHEVIDWLEQQIAVSRKAA